MGKKKFTAIFILFAGLALSAEIFAQGSLWVQTLTYDSISTRRGTWKFPDNPQDYRKILMHYSLKCDPRTRQDQYDCGEWDYLTYNMVYQHTGIMDSTKDSSSLYRVAGRLTSSLFNLTDKPYSDFYKKRYINTKYSQTSNLVVYPSGTSDKELTLGSAGRLQFILTKDELAETGMKKDSIVRVTFNLTASSGIKEISLKMKKALQKTISRMDEDGFTEYFRGPAKINDNGTLTFDLKEKFHWNGTTSIVFELSYTLEDAAGTMTIRGFERGITAIAESGEKFLEFDGNGDWVDCGSYPGLDGAKQFTLEGWVKINKWKNWANIVGKGDNLSIQMGDKTGDLYCIIRGGADNTYGTVKGALPENAWAHLAMVYDGSKATNQEKLKLFLNGEKLILSYNYDIPSATYPETNPFNLTNITHGTAEINGCLDEIRLWDKALDEQTIKEWLNKHIINTHPDYTNLKLYYPLDEIAGNKVKNASGSTNDGILLGAPVINTVVGYGLTRNVQLGNFNPSISLITGDFIPANDTSDIIIEKPVAPASIETMEISGYKPVRKSIRYAWLEGYSYTYDETGKAVDSVFHEKTETLANQKLYYYKKPFEKITEYEIGRYITPYGKGLNLGPDGFTWMYDVTDYAPLLKGDVDFSAGNQQELIDVKFEFIPGETPRDVVAIQQLWGPMRSYSYRDLSDDKVLNPLEITLNEKTKTCKIITRLTGHGHNSNDGSYPHCCEWKDNIHSLISGKGNVASWHIFQYDDCALNPVFPQGGTWPGSREGWCPGDVVKDNEFELTSHVENGKIYLDYDITKVPTDNQGMGGGNYVVCMQLIEYGETKNVADIEICEVITPNINPYFSRKNPICSNPTIVIRNNGSEPVTKLTFDYGISDGKQESYIWTGSIKPMEKDTVVLPLPNTLFWLGGAKSTFNIKSSKPNDQEDKNTSNDSYSVNFELPDLYDNEIYLVCKSNSRTEGFYYYVTDWQGNKVVNRPSFIPNNVYKERINFGRGCYTLKFVDENNLGLSYWAYPDQGSGYLRIEDASGKILKTFSPDFGHGITYSFDLGGFLKVREPNEDEQIIVFPNPTFEYINFDTGYLEGKIKYEISDVSGKTLITNEISAVPYTEMKIDITTIPTGSYFFTVFNNGKAINKRFIKN